MDASLEDARLFIVDDEDENRDVLNSLLKEIGFDAQAFESGPLAIKAAREAPPDLLLLDINMPGMDGYEVCKIFKADDHLKEIPVIFISGLTDTQNIIHALRAGGVDYITKPFRIEEVLARVKAHLALIYERRKSERLLLNILPEKVIAELKATGNSQPEFFEDVTILFADIVGFTRKASDTPAPFLIRDLNEIFTAFDEIVDKHQCQRIKTIGDAYLAVGGNPTPGKIAARNMVHAAIEMLAYIRERKNLHATDPERAAWEVRIGVHTGSAIGAVVGIKKYIYDLIGDGINTAFRIQNTCDPMQLIISEDTHSLVKDAFTFLKAERPSLKGKGEIQLYLYP